MNEFISQLYSGFGLLWQVTEVRPKVTLVVRMAAAVANYDYIVDWEFQTDGLIRAKVSIYYCSALILPKTFVGMCTIN